MKLELKTGILEKAMCDLLTIGKDVFEQRNKTLNVMAVMGYRVLKCSSTLFSCPRTSQHLNENCTWPSVPLSTYSMLSAMEGSIKNTLS